MSDDFYRRCWLKLKAERPRLCKLMDAIEINTEGIVVQPKPKAKKNEQPPITRV